MTKMNDILPPKLSDMNAGNASISTETKIVETNGHNTPSGDSPPMERPNPWKARNPSSTNSECKAADSAKTERNRSNVNVSSTEKLFEAEAWPEPSEKKGPVTAATGSKAVDDRPRNRKPSRKWQNVDIEFQSTRGSRGGMRVPPVVASAIPPPLSGNQMSGPSSSGQPVGPRGGPRRGTQSSSAPFMRGRGGGRSMNGSYQSMRQSNFDASNRRIESEDHNDRGPESNHGADIMQRSMPTATVYASRGSGFSNRSRRPGGPRGGYNHGYKQNNTQNHSSAGQHNATGQPMAPLAPVTYLMMNQATQAMVPSSLIQLQMAGAQASAIPAAPVANPPPHSVETMPALQSAVILSQGTNTAQGVSSEASSASSAPIATLVSLDEMLSIITEVGWSKTRVPEYLRSLPAISSAMEAAGLTATTESSTDEGPKEPAGDGQAAAPSPGVKREDVINADERFFFVPRNVYLTRFLKLTSKHDFIRHHVEYYFSDINLSRDQHLKSVLMENNQVCPLDTLLAFNRLRWVHTTEQELLDAVSGVPTLNIVYGGQREQRAVGIASRTSLLRLSASKSPHAPGTTDDGVTKASANAIELSAELAGLQIDAAHPVTASSTSAVSPTAQLFLPTSTSSASAATVVSLPMVMQGGRAGTMQPVSGPQTNLPTPAGGQLFPAPHLLPYPGVPSLPFFSAQPYIMAPGPPPPHPQANGAAGDVTAVDSTAMYYRALLAASGYPQAAAHQIQHGPSPQVLASYAAATGNQHQQPFYLPFVPPAVNGPSHPASAIVRNGHSPFFMPTAPQPSYQGTTPGAAPQSGNPVPAPKFHAVSVRNPPARPPSNRQTVNDAPAQPSPQPPSGNGKSIDPTNLSPEA